MQKLVIHGGKRLEGEIPVHGAKNSALPLLAAAVLAQSETVLHNCPRLSDVDAACRILSYLGCKCRRDGSSVVVDTSGLVNFDVPDPLMREMRSSIVFLGAILGRLGRCKLSFPGGCELGPRPIDLHLSALRKLGADISEEYGYLDCTAPKGLHGAKISLSFPSVGATENIMLAAATAKGETEIQNAAREPEIVDLAEFLNRCGAKIRGAGDGTIYISGVERLSGCDHDVIPDRIVTATYLCCAAITRGELLVTNSNADHVSSILPILEHMGCGIYGYGNRNIYINAKRALSAVPTVRTMPYPGFPTDAQALLMALCSTVSGTTVFVENIFESRFKQAGELRRLGASIKVEGKVAIVEGVNRLTGAEVEATDLRGGAALVIAGLYAEGTTGITNIPHIDRGYESIEKNLSQAGADIKRISKI